MEVNVLLTRKFYDEDINYLRSNISDEVNLIIPPDYEPESLFKLSGNAHIFLGSIINEKLIENAKALKFIQIPWTGVENLDFSIIEKTGVVVCNTHSNAYAVAEFAISLYLAAAKKITYHDFQLRKGIWNRPLPDNSNKVSPFSSRVFKSKITIIGYGSIGKYIKRFLYGFECEFHIVDMDTPQSSEPSVFFYKPERMQEAVSSADAVFVCIPLTPATSGLIDKKLLNSMKKNTILINISRGEIIVEEDLYNCLMNKSIAAAAIDTWYRYPDKSSPVVEPSSRFDFGSLQNLILSPHRAAFIEGDLPHLRDAVTNINRAAAGLDPLNIISVKKKF